MTMVAAPFYGEFGWEVALWVPWLRWQRRKVHRQCDFEVLCKIGHEVLYEDFATKVTGVKPPKGITKIDCQNVWVDGAQIRDWPAEVSRLLRKKVGPARVIHPQEMRVRWDPVPTTRRFDYQPYGVQRMKVKGRVGLHIRRCHDKQPERNWDPLQVGKLLGMLTKKGLLKSAVFFGTLDDAVGSVLGYDRRGAPLSELVEHMAECELVVGPSSGPLHLANLCGTPVVWWSGNAKDVPRYNKVWNPFKCLNEQASASWDPSVEEIVDAVARLRDRLSRRLYWRRCVSALNPFTRWR